MTDQERIDRNPAPEVARFDPTAHPIVTADELEFRRVYVIQSDRYNATMNYLGKTRIAHPETNEPMVVYRFFGPRVGLDVYLTTRPDGSFTDAADTRLTVRRYIGEDA